MCKVQGQFTALTTAHDQFAMHEFAPCATSARDEKNQVHDCNSLLWVQIRRFACCDCDEMCEMHLADVGGFATHVGSCDDLEPGLPSLHAAVILDEVHALLSLHTRMPALEQDVHLMMQARKSGEKYTRRQRGTGKRGGRSKR